jgi:hypothetical protein
VALEGGWWWRTEFFTREVKYIYILASYPARLRLVSGCISPHLLSYNPLTYYRIFQVWGFLCGCPLFLAFNYHEFLGILTLHYTLFHCLF